MRPDPAALAAWNRANQRARNASPIRADGRPRGWAGLPPEVLATRRLHALDEHGVCGECERRAG